MFSVPLTLRTPVSIWLDVAMVPVPATVQSAPRIARVSKPWNLSSVSLPLPSRFHASVPAPPPASTLPLITEPVSRLSVWLALLSWIAMAPLVVPMVPELVIVPSFVPLVLPNICRPALAARPVTVPLLTNTPPALNSAAARVLDSMRPALEAALPVELM